jgi:tetratricopeptide (TPR) repeat protein
METQSHLGLQQWAEAESTARRALALDPDDQTAANQLAHALRLQNKMAENADQVAWLLERDPEDPDSHCTAGWAALQRGEFRVAERHFLEALRLEPEMENAREGVLESFRARSPLYRAYLAYSFRMARLSQNARWGVIIGLYVGVKFARRLLTGPYAPAAKVLGFLYLVFVLWVWLARGIGNFILLLDRFASHALRRNEKIEASFVGGSLCAALLFILLSLFLKNSGLFLAGFSFLAAAIPFSLTFTNKSATGKWLFGSIGSICLLSGVASAVESFHPEVLPSEMLMLLIGVGIGGAVLTTWIGNIPALRR